MKQLGIIFSILLLGTVLVTGFAQADKTATVSAASATPQSIPVPSF